MISLQIDLINPEAEKFLEELARLNLIRIRPAQASYNTAFQQLLEKIRSRTDLTSQISEEEIALEVDLVRTKHQEKYAKDSDSIGY